MSELKFKVDTKQRKQWFTGMSFSHPAKMSLPLQLWIIENYTKVGETILDPMAGSGTILTACSLGRNVIAIELEGKFVEMMKGNWEKIRQRGAQLGYKMGDCQILQGDSRNLEGLVDKIISSPPYADKAVKRGSITGTAHQVVRREATDNLDYSDNPSNIGNLPYGSIDKIVTSPPYEAGTSGPSRGPFWDRLANDPTSARYGRKKHPSVGQGYDQVDAVVTSPPYEGTTGEGKEIGSEGHAVGAFHYGDDSRQIGNLKSQSYLEAMLQVYQQCWGVLRPGGLMILVTKNFIRNKQVIRLDTDTIKLCEQAGFSYLERHYRKLPAQSFWRVIYHQKHPEVEQIKHEDVLVFKKR
ncbi:hypothetical protein LCGC14_0420410 [marine sediment metagenome]|uniref:DNA methylase N-4/N-6 domain-containing protein n=1 Tax=marine sediment metagenome TaxID=412755 RepID=A0A0F9T8Z4_9ZZZZ